MSTQTNNLKKYDTFWQNGNIKVIILGTFPGTESNKSVRYYISNRNSFWKIMGEILEIKNLEVLAKRNCKDDHETALTALRDNNIALLDLYEQCSRIGSKDKTIRDEIFNNALSHYPDATILCNGSKSYTECIKLQRENIIKNKNILQLPSSSNAHSIKLDFKTEKWREALSKI